VFIGILCAVAIFLPMFLAGQSPFGSVPKFISHDSLETLHIMILPILFILYWYVSFKRPIGKVSIQIVESEVLFKGHPSERTGHINEFQDLRVLEMGDKEFWVVFNYGKKKKIIKLLKNLDQESAEKAVDWLKEKLANNP
jgi:hypothetical protein